MQDFVGQILDGKYRVERELGRGGMGAVYFAYHLGTKRPVALKVIVPQLMKRSEFVERFKREAEAAGRLRHQNVVNVTDFGFADTAEGQVAYLVMEYLDGCTLGEILEEEGKLSLSWTVDILEQVCSAVDEAHRQGIIHRDLKPDNIWLEPNERGGYTAKVLDFGIAKLENQPQDPYQIASHQSFRTDSFYQEKTIALIENTDATSESETIVSESGNVYLLPKAETKKRGVTPNVFPKPDSAAGLSIHRHATKISDLPAITENKTLLTANAADNLFQPQTADITRVGAVMGTPLYMSPEQCRGERLSSASDIYSLGIITYQMLGGKTPFDGEALSILYGHLEQKPPALPVGKVPRKVKKVVYQALAKEPVNRPPTAEVFAGQMRSYSEGIVKLFRRSLVIYGENFSKLIWFSLLLYFPTILLTIFGFFDVILNFKGIIPQNASVLIQGVLKFLNISASIVAETLVAAAVLWIVVQYIETPLRSFSVKKALQALAGKWRQFAWILPLRIIISLFIQGDFTHFGIFVMYLLSLIESLIFWAVPCVIMMENVGGLASIKRAWQLTRRAIPTITAAILLNFLILITASTALTSLVLGVVTVISPALFPSLVELSYEELAFLIQPIALILIKIVGTILMPFYAVLYALIYLKTRYAGGESTKKLLAEFKDANIPQSNWQRKIRQRLSQSGRFSNNF